MGWGSERKAVQARLADNWTTTVIKFENVPLKKTYDKYIALFIRHGERDQLTLGSDPTVRSTSLVIIQIFVPKDTGTDLAKAYADTLAALFDRIQLIDEESNLLSFETADIEEVGEDGAWYQVNVTVPYTRIEN